MIRTEARFRFALLASTALSAVPAMAGDRLPTGGSVAHGSVDISTPAANAMAIRQSSDTAIVNWRGFSIGEGARVDIHQPGASSAMLNRVTGSTPSSIAGQLNANGQVYLVNPNGIAITPTGTVKTGAFVASTLATTDEDFIAGRRSFQGKGRSAAVVNQGSIEVGRGGYAALIGGKVDNSGTITASMGKIGLGAGERATLDISGDGFLQVGVPSDDDGDDAPLIRHSGRLSADGGRVEVKAATARQMARQVVNLSGVVEARSVGGRSGAIVLGGGDGGRVRVSGRLDASAPRAEPAQAVASITPPPPRPAITITGAAIELAGATLDASGPGRRRHHPHRRRLAGRRQPPARRDDQRRRRHDDRRRRPRCRQRRQRRRLVGRAHDLRRPHIRPWRPAGGDGGIGRGVWQGESVLHRSRRPVGGQGGVRNPLARSFQCHDFRCSNHQRHPRRNRRLHPQRQWLQFQCR